MRWMIMTLMLLTGSLFATYATAEPQAQAACCCEGQQAHCDRAEMADMTAEEGGCHCGMDQCHCGPHCVGGHAAVVLSLPDAETAVAQMQVVASFNPKQLPSPYLKTPAKPPRV